MIRSKKWKLIRERVKGMGSMEADNSAVTMIDTETYELYDLEADPGEEENIVKEYPDILEELLKELEGWNTLVAKNRQIKSAPLAKDLLEQMRSHGYW